MQTIGEILKYEYDREEVQERIRKQSAEITEKCAAEYPDCTVTDSFIFDYSHFKRQEAACEGCEGLPCKKKSNLGIKHKPQVDYLNNLVMVSYECQYARAARLEKRIARQFAAAQIPPKYNGKTWGDYEINADNENAVLKAKETLETKLWLYLYGECGTGKTFLASLIAQESLARNRTVIFKDVPYLLTRLRSSFGKDPESTFEEKLDTLISVDVLVLDDLGTEQVTKWGIEQLYTIINARYIENRQTIITSNYALAELEDLLNHPKDAPADVQGKRIARRICERGKILWLKGGDKSREHRWE